MSVFFLRDDRDERDDRDDRDKSEDAINSCPPPLTL